MRLIDAYINDMLEESLYIIDHNALKINVSNLNKTIKLILSRKNVKNSLLFAAVRR